MLELEVMKYISHYILLIKINVRWYGLEINICEG